MAGSDLLKRTRDVAQVVENYKKPEIRALGAAIAEGLLTMNANHRQFPRAPMSGPVKFFQWNEPRQAEVTEISGGGVFLRTQQVLAEGAMVTLRVTLPGLKRAFTVLGKVVRTVKGGLFAPPGMGVRFVDLSPGDRQTILDYVALRSPQFAEAM